MPRDAARVPAEASASSPHNDSNAPGSQPVPRPENAALVVALSERIARYCASAQVPFLDFHSALVGSDGRMKEGVSEDGVHRNEKGYAILKPLAEQAVAEALKTRPPKDSSSRSN